MNCWNHFETANKNQKLFECRFKALTEIEADISKNKSDLLLAGAILFNKFHVECIQFNKASDDFVNSTCIYICQRRKEKYL